MQFMKSAISLMASSIALGLAAGPLKAQQTPMATYNTDVFDYWHLNGETWGDEVAAACASRASKFARVGPLSRSNRRC